MLGIAFTDNEIHAVFARGTAAKGSVEKTFTEKLQEGAIQKGMLLDMEKVVEVLTKIRKTSGTKNVVICLPPEQVYCVNFIVTSDRGTSFQERLEAAIEQHIPEERTALQYQTKILQSSKEKKQVGVIAVRKDILQGWQAACQKAGLTMKSILSLPLSVAEKGSYALVAAGSSCMPTLTLFYSGWPIDEAVLPKQTSTSEVVDELKGFIEEYKSEYPVSSIRVSGRPDLLKNIQDVFAPKEKSKNEESLPSFSVTAIFSRIAEKEMPMLGAIAASLSGKSGFNLLHTQKKRTTVAVVMAFISVVVVCTAVVAYFRPDLLDVLGM